MLSLLFNQQPDKSRLTLGKKHLICLEFNTLRFLDIRDCDIIPSLSLVT